VTAPAETRARRLLRCYPPVWRERYGDEFAELLAADLAERPRCLRRDFDVVRSGLGARIAAAGISNGPIRDPHTTAGMALGAVLVFAAAATSIWTQLIHGAHAHGSGSTAVSLGLVTLSAAGLALLAVGGAAAIALTVAIGRAIRRGGGRALVRPAATLAASGAVLVLGALRIAAHAHGPTPLARWTWAATESISTYWIHPGRLLALPASEVAWMLASPLAALLCCRALRQLARAADLTTTPRTWRRTARALAGAVLMPALVAAATWVLGSQHESRADLRAGSLDLALIAAMTIALLAVVAATRRRAEPTPS
jgi:hypothetical protein